MKAYKESGGTTPLILNLDTRRRMVGVPLLWQRARGTHLIEVWAATRAEAIFGFGPYSPNTNRTLYKSN